MQDTVIKHLIALNSKFYQTFAVPFSATRMRIQPGVRRILKNIRGDEQILDLGCGNGEIYSALRNISFHGLYTGIDSNVTFLTIAERKTQNLEIPDKDNLLLADLTEPTWVSKLPKTHYDLIFAFAVIHHIPSQFLRKNLFHQIHDLLLQTSGSIRSIFFHSEWQFLNNPRFYSRIVPWNTIGLLENDIEPGDYLIDWRFEGYGIRYVHHFEENELEQLAHENGFQIVDSFYSDGEGGKLSLYQSWILE